MTDPALRGSQRRWLAPAVALATALLGVLVGVAVLRASGIDVARRAWLLRVQLLGPEPVGIWQSDERLGWRHVPGASGRQRDVPDYDVAYHIDAEGHRLTPGAEGREGPTVLFLGGSFTFGHGVEDHAPYPALLQSTWPNRRVVNAAVNAWGSAQALLLLRDVLESESDLALVVYGFITHHLKRNHLSKAWLLQLEVSRGRRNPWFELVGDDLVFRGLADPRRDGRRDDRTQLAREVQTTARLLAEMARECHARGVPFVVVHLPDGGDGIALEVLRRSVGSDRLIDLETPLDYVSLRHQHDVHLTEAGHRQVADALRPELERRIWAR